MTVCFCALVKMHQGYLPPCGWYNLPLIYYHSPHPLLPAHSIYSWDITGVAIYSWNIAGVVKKYLKIQHCYLGGGTSYKTLLVYLCCVSGVPTVSNHRATVASIFQIGISRNTKCGVRDSFTIH